MTPNELPPSLCPPVSPISLQPALCAECQCVSPGVCSVFLVARGKFTLFRSGVAPRILIHYCFIICPAFFSKDRSANGAEIFPAALSVFKAGFSRRHNAHSAARTPRPLLRMAAYFGDQALIERTEQVIAEELAEVQDQVAAYKARLDGKTAALFVGGSRSHHYQGLLKDFGVTTVLAGYEFGHRDDYEGREIIPNIKEDADSKNIEHITVEKDEKKYHAYLTQEQYDKLAAEIPLEQYKGMEEEMGVPWMRASFFGVEDTSTALRQVADRLNDDTARARAEALIAERGPRAEAFLEQYKPHFVGKKAAIFVGGGFKAISLIRQFNEMGIETVVVGTQTGKPEDYEVISSLVNPGTVILDDANPAELETFMKQKGADILVGGVKERPLAYKLGIAFCDHNHERKHALGGFEGVENFTREVNLSLNSPVWQFTRGNASFAEAARAQAGLVHEALAARAAHF